MKSPGVSTKPILLISGKSPFCETFFDNVRVPKGRIIGEINKGWEVAKYLLTHEREMISAIGLPGGRPLGQIAADSLGMEAGILADTCLRADIARFDVDAYAFQLALERTGDQLKAKQASPAISSMLKYYGAELNKRRHELLMSAGGSQALEWESERSRHGEAARSWLRTKANSIEGGTSEVQLNVIAKRILELPGA
jgi:acyl-CoA dehydrogenase